MEKFVLILLLFFIAVSCETRVNSQKVFDVHLHGAVDSKEQLQRLKKNGVYTTAVSTSWQQQQMYTSTDSLKIIHGLMFPCPEGKVPYSRQNCFENGEEWPALDWVQHLIEGNKIQFIGEVLAQYHGISPADTSMYPYYRLAEKNNLPVGIHTGSAGPDHGCPNFVEEMGDPLLLRDILKTFPTLRVWVMHAGGPPYIGETIEIMKEYPKVYADISVINNPHIVKPELFAGIMQSFIDAGFEDRLMFGSDNGDIEVMIHSVQCLPFLSDEQKDKILYKNAETFFSTSGK